MRARIIAEFTSNHGGDLTLALECVHAAAEAGADYAKFQSWQAQTLRDPADPQHEWFERAELTDDMHYRLIDECRARGVEFLTTCFDIRRVDFLATLGLATVKVGSPDVGSEAMLRALRGRFEHVILSVGLARDAEVAAAVEWLSPGRLTLLHCVSVYPMPPAAANLRRMEWLRRLCPSVGWSDHALGLDVARVALAAGAQYIEKHVCLGRSGRGRTSPWDITPDELASLVRYADEVEAMLGEAQPPLSPEQLTNRTKFIGRFGTNA